MHDPKLKTLDPANENQLFFCVWSTYWKLKESQNSNIYSVYWPQKSLLVYFSSESATLRGLRPHVPCVLDFLVPSCFRATFFKYTLSYVVIVPHVLCALPALVSHVSRVLLAFLTHMHRFLRASHASCSTCYRVSCALVPYKLLPPCALPVLCANLNVCALVFPSLRWLFFLIYFLFVSFAGKFITVKMKIVCR